MEEQTQIHSKEVESLTSKMNQISTAETEAMEKL